MANDDPLNGRIPRSAVYGTRGVVVSGHSLASIEGLRVLDSGGSVIDTMLATSAVLTVVIPQATSLGSDAFVLYWDAETETLHALNASGPAPAEATPDRFRDGMVARGPLAANVPGLVRGWEVLHGRFGRLPWQALFDRAIHLAENGHPLSRLLARNLVAFRGDVERDAGCRDTYFRDGEPMAEGAVVRLPALAETLKLIATNGSSVFYDGPIAAKIGAYSRAHGGLLDEADFNGYQPEWVAPIGTSYRGFDVRVMPPNSFGLLMLLQLNALSTLESADLAGDDVARIVFQMRAMDAAMAEGRRYIADPNMAELPVDRLLGAETTENMAAMMQRGEGVSAPAEQGSTSCICIADARGNAACVVQSIFHAFGSAFLEPETGILLSNRMTGFTTEPGHPNQVAPRKRPAHTLNPVMVFRNGKPKFLLATPGGPSQTMTSIQMLTNLIDRRMDLATAVEAPRWSVDRKAGRLIELCFPACVAEGIRGSGYDVGSTKSASFFGSVKAVEFLPGGVMCGVSDFRREAFAVAS